MALEDGGHLGTLEGGDKRRKAARSQMSLGFVMNVFEGVPRNRVYVQ